jgi:hypothetical protein
MEQRERKNKVEGKRTKVEGKGIKVEGKGTTRDKGTLSR